VWDRLRRRVRSGDEGFTLVELLVTMFIIATVLLGLVGVQVSALITTTLAKQRQQATALANQAMEELRALPFSTVSGGLYSGDLAGDPNIAGSAFKPSYDASIDETLVTSGIQPVAYATPLYPHVASNTVGGISFATSTYVTLAGVDASEGYWLTVIVDWTSKNTGWVKKTTVVRTRAYSPSGCLSTTDHPFSGPCQNFLDGSAGTTGAAVTVAATTDGADIISGVDLTSATLDLPLLSSGIRSEQVLSATAQPATSGGQYVTSSGTESWDATAASTQADTDPGSGALSTPDYEQVSQSAGSAPSAPNAGGWSLTVDDGSSDTVSSASTLQATSGTNCADTYGTIVTNNGPCGSAAGTSGGGGVTLAMPSAAGGSRTFEILQTGAPANDSRAFTSLYTSPSASYCSGTSSIGCVHADSVEYLGDVTAGGLGSGYTTATNGFNNSLVTVTGYTARASAESGIGTLNSVNSLAGSLTYWTGTAGGYTTVPLSTPGTYDVAAASATYATGVTVTASAQITISAGQLTTDGAAPCQTDACATVSTSGGVVAIFTYNFADSVGNIIANFTATVNLGAATAHTSYKAAYSG